MQINRIPRAAFIACALALLCFALTSCPTELRISSYTVTFDSQEADSAASPATITDTEPATTVGSLPSQPEKTGYTFNGWWTGPFGGSLFDASTLVSEDITVYANWEPIPYTLIYDGNGVTSEDLPVDASYDYNSWQEVAALPAGLQKDGHFFAGWMSAQDGSGTSYLPGKFINVRGDVTLYAIWIPNSFTIDTGSGVIKLIRGIGAAPSGALVIPEGVTSVGYNLFGTGEAPNTSITSVSLPASLREIDNWAFIFCMAISSYSVAAASPTFASFDGIVYDKADKKLIMVPRTQTSLTVRDGVTEIGKYAC